jgi:hypothetical protein
LLIPSAVTFSHSLQVELLDTIGLQIFKLLWQSIFFNAAFFVNQMVKAKAKIAAG